MIKSVKLWLYITCLTLRTPNWIRKTFYKMCELDIAEPISTPYGVFTGKCSTVVLKRGEYYGFVMSEGLNCGLRVTQRDDSGQWKEVYRDGGFISSLDWVRQLKEVHSFLLMSGSYQKASWERLEDSAMGVM